MNDLTHKKIDLHTKLYKELNDARDKFLKLPSKEDILYAGEKYATLRDIVYVMEDMLNANLFEDDDIDAFLLKDNLLEEVWNNTSPADEINNIVEAAFYVIGKEVYYSELDFG